jgi:putative hemolysin
MDELWEICSASKKVRMKSILTLTTILILLTSCSAPPPQPMTAPVPTVLHLTLPSAGEPAPTLAHIPNPASAYCEEQGNELEIRTAADGSQSGVCVFADGSECEEWAYFRGECAPVSAATEPPVLPTQVVPDSPGVVIPQTVPMPAGVIIDPHTGSLDLTEGLTFYSKDGLILGELAAPRASEVHVAGRYQGSLNFPLVFHAFELESQRHSLKMNGGSTLADPGGQVSLIAPMDEKAMLSGLVGVPGEPILFYIVFQPLGSILQSTFVLGNIDSIAMATPLGSLDNSNSRYWKPLAIQMRSGNPSGLWLTQTPWGIGGDIVFPYYEGLGLFDLETGTVTEVLPSEAEFNSISNDQTWIAYSQHTETLSPFFIHNLVTGNHIAIPTLAENIRGAGDGIFSPSNEYIAWREAQGSLYNGNFQQTIRVATLDGQIVGDFKDVPFYKTADLGGEGTEVRPVGWLDDESILVQVLAHEKPHDGTVVKLNVRTGEFSLFAQGFFAGWFYQ